MSTPSPVDLTLRETDDLEPFFNTCKAVFSIDMDRQTPPVPEYREILVARAAKLADGRIAGGIIVKLLWNSLEVLQLAVNPGCPVAGTEAALLRWAEEAARGELGCNQIFLSDFSWRPRSFYEAFGYTLMWEQPNYPRGYARYYVEKVWATPSRGEPVCGYEDAAAAPVTLEEWDAKEAAAPLREWSEVARQRVTGEAVSPYTKESHAVQGVLADGTLATQCFYSVTWNVLWVHILVVLPECQRGGVGSVMLREIDALARRHHCDDVCLETMSWQARPFYEKNGFTHVATQDDIPMGFQRHWMLHHVPQAAASTL